MNLVISNLNWKQKEENNGNYGNQWFSSTWTNVLKQIFYHICKRTLTYLLEQFDNLNFPNFLILFNIVCIPKLCWLCIINLVSKQNSWHNKTCVKFYYVAFHFKYVFHVLWIRNQTMLWTMKYIKGVHIFIYCSSI